ncbi:MAG: amidase [Gemmatimonadota bacterium]
MTDGSGRTIPRRTFVATLAASAAVPWPRVLRSDPRVSRLTDGTLHFASATVLAEAIRQKKVSSAEVVEACLRRIEQVNPKLNAVVQLIADTARAGARQADADLALGKLRGPLHGVPFTVKDSFETAGVISTAGTQGWAKRIPAEDATIVARIRAAGAILLGKTNTPEFTWSDETDNLVYGRTSNPYDLTRTPGGSSGGPAAILASGGSPLDVGSDTGNSIRMPAHNCGITGIKPTAGRVSKSGHAISYRGILESWTQVGPMARFVEDLVLVLPLVSGVDGRDPHAAPAPLLDPGRVDVRGLRVVVFTDNPLRTPTPETVRTVEAAAAALRTAGARVDRQKPPGLDDATELWHKIVFADGGAWLHRLLQAAGTPGTGSLGEIPSNQEVPSGQLTHLVEQLDEVRSQLLRFMQGVDLIVCPVMAMPAVHHGDSAKPGYADGYNEPHNITGWPVAVVRAGTSSEGLPIGVQLVAQPWREDVALAAARVVETASGGWKAPPL